MNSERIRFNSYGSHIEFHRNLGHTLKWKTFQSSFQAIKRFLVAGRHWRINKHIDDMATHVLNRQTNNWNSSNREGRTDLLRITSFFIKQNSLKWFLNSLWNDFKCNRWMERMSFCARPDMLTESRKEGDNHEFLPCIFFRGKCFNEIWMYFEQDQIQTVE